MKLKKLPVLLLFILCLACNFHAKKDVQINADATLLLPLDSNVIYYQDTCPFDTLYSLIGEKLHLDDTLLNKIQHISFRDSQVVLHSDFKSDTVPDKIFYRLSMNPNSGTFVVNPAKNRMVFAYEYYHLFYVMDLEAKTVKTIDFKNGQHHYEHEKGVCLDCINPNTIYYHDAFAGENYFYLLYWGHSCGALLSHADKSWKWSNAKREYVKTAAYQQDIPNIVEQYDWNGNPVRRYLLEGDPGNCFVVDEKNRQIYLLASGCYATFMSAIMCNH